MIKKCVNSMQIETPHLYSKAHSGKTEWATLLKLGDLFVWFSWKNPEICWFDMDWRVCQIWQSKLFSFVFQHTLLIIHRKCTLPQTTLTQLSNRLGENTCTVGLISYMHRPILQVTHIDPHRWSVMTIDNETIIC